MIIAGSQVLLATAVRGGGVPPWEAARVIWRRPVPPVAAGLVAAMAAMAVVQTVHPAVVGDLQREPEGGWWRCLTAMLVAICGPVSALAVRYALRGPLIGLRLLATLVPTATVVLCALTNNHGVGLAVGMGAVSVYLLGGRAPGGAPRCAVNGPVVALLAVVAALRAVGVSVESDG